MPSMGMVSIEVFLVRLLYMQALKVRKMNNIIENSGETQFANGQSNRDLRALFGPTLVYTNTRRWKNE
jgi:hypothetical protein